jgi:dTDP-4-dehydrorhamnose reductase
MVLVTGARGQLGFDVCRELTRLGIENAGADVADFDLTDEDQTRGAILRARPDTVVHCAAFTAVDKAEAEPALCRAVNVDGTAHVAAACAELGAKMVYISTDYVFGGQGDAPFEVDAPKKPINQYGLTKALGEDAVLNGLSKFFIVRISWVFGANGANFVKTMTRLGKERPVVRVVDDQVGSPTYTVDLAALLVRMIQTEQYGVYHATNEGFCSWYEFAKAILERAGLSCGVEPISTSAYPVAAKRPLNSRLSKASLDAAGFARLPCWQDALGRYFG